MCGPVIVVSAPAMEGGKKLLLLKGTSCFSGDVTPASWHRASSSGQLSLPGGGLSCKALLPLNTR